MQASRGKVTRAEPVAAHYEKAERDDGEKKAREGRLSRRHGTGIW